MTTAEIEQTKLLANAINTVATSCFTVGIATPLAGYLYNISGFRSLLTFGELAGGIGVWFLAGAALHLGARHVLRRLDT